MFVIIASKRLNINPDNVATPIAASLGDLVTLSILSGLGTFLYQISIYCQLVIFLLLSNQNYVLIVYVFYIIFIFARELHLDPSFHHSNFSHSRANIFLLCQQERVRPRCIVQWVDADYHRHDN